MTNQQSSSALVPCLLMTLLGYFLVSRYRDAVTTADLVFPIGYFVYVHVANFICFDSNKLQLEQLAHNNTPLDPMGKDSLGRGQFINEKSFIIYFVTSKIISLLIPLVMICVAPTNNIIAVQQLIPSLVQVLAQFVGEQSTGACHDVVRVIVPIGFVTYRLFGPDKRWAIDSYTLWLQQQQTDIEQAGTYGDHWYTFNVVLAWMNLVFASYNLFVFLLLRMLPIYFDKVETPTVEMAYTLVPLPKKKKKTNNKDE